MHRTFLILTGKRKNLQIKKHCAMNSDLDETSNNWLGNIPNENEIRIKWSQKGKNKRWGVMVLIMEIHCDYMHFQYKTIEN